ncbi:hypothetical protein ACJX0J_021827, partial [Zea mays]
KIMHIHGTFLHISHAFPPMIRADLGLMATAIKNENGDLVYLFIGNIIIVRRRNICQYSFHFKLEVVDRWCQGHSGFYEFLL